LEKYVVVVQVKFDYCCPVFGKIRQIFDIRKLRKKKRKEKKRTSLFHTTCAEADILALPIFGPWVGPYFING
jgi:hypothetical protein